MRKAKTKIFTIEVSLTGKAIGQVRALTPAQAKKRIENGLISGDRLPLRLGKINKFRILRTEDEII